ncbi:hypothetical protein N7491_009556 [Penicillium cf. griseofulvum]|uniref:Uncharacterized protein n=1 Tax=Penicillium cf. griseofulvum TaxID=2972120 RepID=A0A9W9MDZ7_9EURO|nr:hypothetical protein N7472_004850 [Penicillium cf. griseofulvum]KAJ5424340.1 hypothetical protein N7491_009556 [Penicillium cf. griseofulvum]KAJ5442418.1 hypothetical protein N7445_005425 [Penicillium cf. griseofulvum]
MAESTAGERCLAPELRQALDDLKAAVHSANCCLTTFRFLDSFPHLSTQHSEIQKAVEKVARFAQDQEENTNQAVQQAQRTFEALSPEHQNGLMQYYGEDLRFYLEIALPPDLSRTPTPLKEFQVLLFDIENFHRALARVRGVEANIADIFFGLPSIQRLMWEIRDEELRLLELRSSAEVQLHRQFFALGREQQDLLWLWYQDFMGISRIQRDGNAQYPYSVRT